jgi:hypothetical protein
VDVIATTILNAVQVTVKYQSNNVSQRALSIVLAPVQAAAQAL